MTIIIEGKANQKDSKAILAARFTFKTLVKLKTFSL